LVVVWTFNGWTAKSLTKDPLYNHHNVIPLKPSSRMKRATDGIAHL